MDGFFFAATGTTDFFYFTTSDDCIFDRFICLFSLSFTNTVQLIHKKKEDLDNIIILRYIKFIFYFNNNNNNIIIIIIIIIII
jgi:hypothetical protein